VIEETPRLTSFARGAGCGCKLPAAELHALLGDLRAVDDERVLVGFDTADDAAVVRVSDDLALVQTVDFFTPVVDDPFDFGAIAAANALSDVYAMGGRPISALSIVAFPLEQLGGGVLRTVMEGALATLAEAAVPLVGGHSIDDGEPKFGLAVTGLVHPDHILANDGARAGDALVLTKPLGTGAIVTHAQRTGEDDALPGAVAVMRTLNGAAGRQARDAGAHAVTDVTGFGLLARAASRSCSTPPRCPWWTASAPSWPPATGSPAARAATPSGVRASPPSTLRSPPGSDGCWRTRRPRVAWWWRSTPRAPVASRARSSGGSWTGRRVRSACSEHRAALRGATGAGAPPGLQSR
jgi:selenium donor protein